MPLIKDSAHERNLGISLRDGDYGIIKPVEKVKVGQQFIGACRLDWIVVWYVCHSKPR